MGVDVVDGLGAAPFREKPDRVGKNLIDPIRYDTRDRIVTNRIDWLFSIHLPKQYTPNSPTSIALNYINKGLFYSFRIEL